MGIVSTLVVLFAYNLIFYNKYFPLTEGWFSVYGELIRRGHIPYVDFHLILPPLYPSIIALIFKVFGNDFIILRIIGIFLIFLIALMVFLLMSRLFPVYIASIIAIAGVIYYQSGTAHITYDFIQLFTAFTLISTYFICLSTDVKKATYENRASTVHSSYLIIAGIFCALAILTKQSNGLVLLLLLSLSVLLINIKNGFNHPIRAIGVFSLGVCVPIVVLILWLYSNDALFAFVSQTFIGASKSKGSLAAILTGWIPRIIYIDQIANFLFVCALFYTLGYKNLVYQISFNDGPRQKNDSTNSSIWLFAVIIVSGLIAIYLPYFNVDLSKRVMDNSYLIFGFYSIIITVLLGSFVLSFSYGIVVLLFQQTAYLLNDDVFIISMTSLGFLLGTATSGGIAEAGSFLGFVMISGYLLSLRSTLNIGKYFFLVCILFFIIFCASKKYVRPYSWWWITEPDIRTAAIKPTIPILKGFSLSDNTVNIIQDVTKTIEKYPVSGDDIFIFPNVPMFYMLTNKFPERFIFIHWYDILPDNLAIAEANRIVSDPPKIIVYLKLKGEVAQGHELLFRDSKLSGQREITKAIKYLTNSGKYNLEKSYIVPDGNVLEVWRLTS